MENNTPIVNPTTKSIQQQIQERIQALQVKKGITTPVEVKTVNGQTLMSNAKDGF